QAGLRTPNNGPRPPGPDRKDAVYSTIAFGTAIDAREPVFRNLEYAVRIAALRPYPTGAFSVRVRLRHAGALNRNRTHCGLTRAARLREYDRAVGAQRAVTAPRQPRLQQPDLERDKLRSRCD